MTKERKTCIHRLVVLCRGEAKQIIPWLEEKNPVWPAFCCMVIVGGCGLYGASVGLWQAPLQAFYAGIKFPLVIFLTILGNSGLNGMLAQVLGLGLTLRQTSLAILMSFVIVALILGAAVPIALFALYNCSSSASAGAGTTYSGILLIHILIIAYAGVMANIRLFGFLKKLTGNRSLARRILIVWLATNMFLGTQLSWLLSPFVGLPHVRVIFLQEHPFERNFFEYAFERAINLIYEFL